MTAEEIIAARSTGQTLSNARSVALDEGHGIAQSVWNSLGPLAGWKIGATSANGQAMLGIDAPIAGRIPQSALRQPGTITVEGDRDAQAEPEIVFRVGADGGIASVHLGIEIVRPSHDDALKLGAGFVVADNAAHVALVIGPEIDVAMLDIPEALKVTLTHNGEPAGDGSAAAVLGDPRRAFDWLASTHALSEGEWVASGAMARACRFARGDGVVADFGAAGRIAIDRA